MNLEEQNEIQQQRFFSIRRIQEGERHVALQAQNRRKSRPEGAVTGDSQENSGGTNRQMEAFHLRNARKGRKPFPVREKTKISLPSEGIPKQLKQLGRKIRDRSTGIRAKECGMFK